MPGLLLRVSRVAKNSQQRTISARKELQGFVVKLKWVIRIIRGLNIQYHSKLAQLTSMFFVSLLSFSRLQRPS